MRSELPDECFMLPCVECGFCDAPPAPDHALLYVGVALAAILTGCVVAWAFRRALRGGSDE